MSVGISSGPDGMAEPLPHISVVTPVYRSQEALEPLYKRVRDALEAHVSENFELIMVDDRSPDDAWMVIQKLVDGDPRVRGLQLSRNFGQYQALTAGLDHARGDWIVIMDCDLQDVPEEIPNLYRKAQEGFDVVLAQRVERQDSFLKRLSSKAFHAVFGYLTDTRQDPSTAQFGIYRRKVIDTILGMRERLRYIPAYLGWVGYRQTAIPVRHAEREHGESGYSFSRLIRLAADSIIAFSDKPLRLTVKLGFAIAAVSILFAATLALYIIIMGPHRDSNAWPIGWASLITAISFFSGLIIAIIGINGLYISRIFDEVKGRPLYIINHAYTNPDRRGLILPESNSVASDQSIHRV